MYDVMKNLWTSFGIIIWNTAVIYGVAISSSALKIMVKYFTLNFMLLWPKLLLLSSVHGLKVAQVALYSIAVTAV